MQKNVAIILIINRSKIVRIESQVDGKCLQKIIGFLTDQYFSNIRTKRLTFWQCFNLNLYWLERACNSTSFHRRIAIILLKTLVIRSTILALGYDSIAHNPTIITTVRHTFLYKPFSLIYHSIEQRKSYTMIYISNSSYIMLHILIPRKLH
jgi:hypothetical protein